MESVNESFDVDGKFREIEKIFEVYKCILRNFSILHS